MPSHLTMRQYCCWVFWVCFAACQFCHIKFYERVDRLCHLPQYDAYHAIYLSLYIHLQISQSAHSYITYRCDRTVTAIESSQIDSIQMVISSDSKFNAAMIMMIIAFLLYTASLAGFILASEQGTTRFISSSITFECIRWKWIYVLWHRVCYSDRSFLSADEKMNRKRERERKEEWEGEKVKYKGKYGPNEWSITTNMTTLSICSFIHSTHKNEWKQLSLNHSTCGFFNVSLNFSRFLFSFLFYFNPFYSSDSFFSLFIWYNVSLLHILASVCFISCTFSFKFLVRYWKAQHTNSGVTSTCKCHFKPVRQFEMCVVYAMAYAHTYTKLHRMHMGTMKHAKHGLITTTTTVEKQTKT